MMSCAAPPTAAKRRPGGRTGGGGGHLSPVPLTGCRPSPFSARQTSDKWLSVCIPRTTQAEAQNRFLHSTAFILHPFSHSLGASSVGQQPRGVLHTGSSLILPQRAQLPPAKPFLTRSLQRSLLPALLVQPDKDTAIVNSHFSPALRGSAIHTVPNTSADAWARA